MKVVLTSILAETNLEAPPKSLFSDVFSRVCNSLGLKEKIYFGLCYEEKQTNDLIWLDTSKKVLKKVPLATKNLNFRLKYYPEDVGIELCEDTTIQLFYLEIKNKILQGEIYCPADIATLLASYSLQVEFGDYKYEKNIKFLMKNQKFLPKRVFKSYNVDPGTWTETVGNMWKELDGLDPEDAMLEYLKLAQNLDMYGVTYFTIQNRKKTKLLLGVTSLGINIYTRNDKLAPQLSFSWSEIKRIKFNGKKIIIKFVTKKVPNFVCYTLMKKRSKQIYNLALGNHELYLRRRRPDRPEVVAMKEKAKIARELRQKRKEKVKLEISSQEEYLRREEGYQKHLQKLQQDLEFTLRKIQEEITEKLEETKKLQEEIEKAKREEEQFKIEKRRIEMEELRERAKIISKNENIDFVDGDLPEIFQVNEKLKKHVECLQKKLWDLVQENEDATLDRIHLDNVREGRNKYQTLSEIKGTSCVRRVKEFDRM